MPLQHVARKINSTPSRPVIKLLDEVTVQSVSIPSTPTNATSGYAADETIQVRVDFGDAVSVTGTPYVVLNIGGAARRATYASGSGTRYLNFEYTVQTGDFDSNGSLALLKPCRRPGLRSDLPGRRTHLRAVRWSCCRTRPACLGQPVGSQGRRDAEFHPQPRGRADGQPGRGRGSVELGLDAPGASASRVIPPSVRRRRSAMPPLRRSPTTTTTRS